MKKITYLLGAGASANALPMIKNTKDGAGLPQQLRWYVDSYRNLIYNTNPRWNQDKYNSLMQIAERSIEFGTPDLYAKFLIETDDRENYALLKMLMSNYFEAKQNHHLQNGTIAFEYRALSFLTTIAKDSQLPENIRIISWNYDQQIEKSAAMLRLHTGANAAIDGFHAWPNIADNQVKRTLPFLLHLNGIAGYNYSPRGLCSREESLSNFTPRETMLSFAWEEEEKYETKTFLKNRIAIAQQMIKDTEILVVIGYSFPFFNRNIDKQLFDRMRSTLSKIYFQDPNRNGIFLYDQFNLLQPTEIRQNPNATTVEIEHIENVEQYYVPFEL